MSILICRICLLLLHIWSMFSLLSPRITKMPAGSITSETDVVLLLPDMENSGQSHLIYHNITNQTLRWACACSLLHTVSVCARVLYVWDWQSEWSSAVNEAAAVRLIPHNTHCTADRWETQCSRHYTEGMVGSHIYTVFCSNCTTRELF